MCDHWLFLTLALFPGFSAQGFPTIHLFNDDFSIMEFRHCIEFSCNVGGRLRRSEYRNSAFFIHVRDK